MPALADRNTLAGMRLELSVPDDFDFRNAVCSHGFFMLAPNRWDPVSQQLETVIGLDEQSAIVTVIRALPRRRLSLACSGRLTVRRREVLRAAVARMLRLDEDLGPFHARCRCSPGYEPAAEARFGRLLRSPALFEDVVKVICTCNVTWRQTVAMVGRLVETWGVPTENGSQRSFPTPARLAAVSPEEIRDRARVGYRAGFIHRLAVDVSTEQLDLAAIERNPCPSDQLYRLLRGIHGVGDYAAGHLCMLLGRYDRLAIDTEMMRYLKTRYPRRKWTPASIRRFYDPWQPYAFLVYWYDLWQDYIRRHGRSDQWEVTAVASRITELGASR